MSYYIIYLRISWINIEGFLVSGCGPILALSCTYRWTWQTKPRAGKELVRSCQAKDLGESAEQSASQKRELGQL